EVNGHEIRRRDYWKYQSIALYDNARQYEAIASQFQAQQPDQAAQYLQFAASFDLQREDVWGSTEVSETTIQQMIDDRLYIDGAEAMGVTVSPDEAELLALNRFSLPDAPLITPQPTPTMSAARADMATATAAAERSIAMGTPVAPPAAGTPDPGVPLATPVPAPPEATPPGGLPATPTLEESRTTADIEFELFRDEVFPPAHMSMDDYTRLSVIPLALRERVDARIVSGVPQSAEQVEAEHILVGTQDLATEIHAQVTGGADFEQIARTSSTDTATAPTGGKLGWITPGQMDPAFADAAFALQPGQISQPVQTQFGWHVIRILDRNADRPLSPEQYSTATDDAIAGWLEAQRAQSDVATEYQPEPTPTPAQFEVPPGAPTPIVATPVPPTEAPLQGPVQVFATPVAASGAASPVGNAAWATPVATPDARSAASKVVPVTTPAASPATGAFPGSGTPPATPQR
nr:peptidylprolyl isomerase [Chloroflexia bacterium]